MFAFGVISGLQQVFPVASLPLAKSCQCCHQSSLTELMMTHSPNRDTLARWVAGARIAPLPAPEGASAPHISFEFFPPKTPALEAQLWTCVERLATLKPRFVSVTYGAGGSTQERTHATVLRLVQETDLTPAAHLTCVGATREEVDEIARQYWDAGV